MHKAKQKTLKKLKERNEKREKFDTQLRNHHAQLQETELIIKSKANQAHNQSQKHHFNKRTEREQNGNTIFQLINE